MIVHVEQALLRVAVALHHFVIRGELPGLTCVEAEGQFGHFAIGFDAVHEDPHVFERLIDGHQLSLGLEAERLKLEVVEGHDNAHEEVLNEDISHAIYLRQVDL